MSLTLVHSWSFVERILRWHLYPLLSIAESGLKMNDDDVSC